MFFFGNNTVSNYVQATPLYENESSKFKQKHLRPNDDNIILLLNFFMNITFKKLQNIVQSQYQSLKIISYGTIIFSLT